MRRAPLDPNLALLRTAQCLTLAGLTAVVPLLPLHLAVLGAAAPAENRLWTAWALAAPAVAQAVAAPLWGRLGDRWGHKWMVVRALAGLAACMALMGASQTPLQFVLCRALQGVCGGVVDASAAYVSARTPEERRGRVLGALHSATAVGSLVGPLVGGMAADALGLRTVLWAAGGLTAVCAAAAALLLDAPPREGTARGGDGPPTGARRRVWAALVAERPARAALVAGLCAQAGAYGLVAVFAPHVAGLSGAGERAATWVGLLQAVTWAASAVGALWWGRRSDRWGVEATLAVTLAGCGASVLLQAWATQVEGLVLLRLVQGFCFSAVVPAVFLAATRSSAADSRGARVGVANALLVAGQVAGALLAGALGGVLSTAGVIAAMGGLFFLGAVAAVAERMWTFRLRKHPMRGGDPTTWSHTRNPTWPRIGAAAPRVRRMRRW